MKLSKDQAHSAASRCGTLITITQSGFEHFPIESHPKTIVANEGGWAHRTMLIEKYLALEAQP